MDIRGWDERYRLQAAAASNEPPTPLLSQTAAQLPRGRALDLASGTGRNAIWLASLGWDVTAVDGSAEAIEILREKAKRQRLAISSQVTDLESDHSVLGQAQWDLVAICYYLQRDLLAPVRHAVKPGGVLLVIVHITEGSEEPTASRLLPGELPGYFAGWEILHQYEGKPDDPAHRRAVSEIVVRRPASAIRRSAVPRAVPDRGNP